MSTPDKTTPTRHAGRRSLAEQVFGRLTVRRDSGQRTDGHVVYLCDCVCGNRDVPVMSSNLTTGNTRSCGCYQADRSRETVRGRHDEAWAADRTVVRQAGRRNPGAA